MILCGKNSVEEVLRHNPERIKELYVSDKCSADSQLETLAKKVGQSIQKVSDEDIKRLSMGESAQGVVSLLNEYTEPTIENLANLSKKSNQPIVILDQINDPHNMGAIFRAAAASKVAGLIYTDKSSAGLTSTVRRVSMGGTELVPHRMVTNLHRTITNLKELEIWVYGTCMSSAAESIYQFDPPRGYAIVLGSEAKGIRELTRKSCDGLLSIPMAGKIQSLNVSQAASVILFELVRKSL